MAADEGLVARVRFAVAVRFGTGRVRSPAFPLDFPARSRAHLLFGIFLARLSNSRIDRAAGNSSRRRIPAGSGRAVRACGVLVCADAAMAIEQLAHADGALLGWHDRLGATGPEFLATQHAGCLVLVL